MMEIQTRQRGSLVRVGCCASDSAAIGQLCEFDRMFIGRAEMTQIQTGQCAREARGNDGNSNKAARQPCLGWSARK